LNAFLLAAGANQVAEDHLHDETVSLPRVERHVRRVLRGPAGAVAGAAVRAGATASWWVRDAPGSDHELAPWQRRLAGLVEQLASFTIEPPGGAAARRAAEDAAHLQAALRNLRSAARRAVLRLPSCFRSFDEHPDDVARMTSDFSRRWPDRQRPLAVVGVRTSGSYTAPLHAAWLRSLGYRDVRVVTWRPDRRWRRWERAALDHVRPAGLAIVTDDPPKSGGSLGKAVAELRKLGFATDSVIPVVPMMDGGVLPAALAEHPRVVIDWRDWAVQARLHPAAVRDALAPMMPDATVLSVQRCPLPARPTARRHVEGRYSVRLQDRHTRETRALDVYVKGVGLGYFGEHSVAVAAALGELLPEVFGLHDGLLYRRWLPDAQRLSDVPDERREALAAAMATYVVERSARLRVDDDLGLRLVDRGAVWQRAADQLGRSFGRWDQFVRPLSHRVARAVLRTDEPSVIDGSMGLDRWFETGPGGALLKTDFDERAFSSLDLHCFDAAFDVAGVDARSGLAPAVRTAHQRLTGRAIDAERWLLYRLVQIAERERDAVHRSLEAERMMASELQGYLAETVFADVEVATGGPTCVLDLDWTLETRKLGFPAMTPAAAFAVRALAKHGFSVVLCSGRSLPEVRQRCAAYRTAGGVAEYGAALYDPRTGEERSLLGAAERDALARLRAVLRDMPGTGVDGLYDHSVRAFTVGREGRRRCLAAEVADRAIEAAGVAGVVRCVPGRHQTDFRVASVDKAAGLDALLGNDRAIALAVGDGVEDLAFLRGARIAVAPRGSELARMPATHIRVARARGPMAVASAVRDLLGHRPGGCPTCKAPAMAARTSLVFAMLAAQDAEGPGRVHQAARVASALRRLKV
jgi:hydroxymethylpyrimidine pyrophosphatase-like HAD family hydrolase